MKNNPDEMISQVDTLLQNMLLVLKRTDLEWKMKIQDLLEALYLEYQKNPGLFHSQGAMAMKGDIALYREKINRYIKKIKYGERKHTKAIEESNRKKWSLFEGIILKDPDIKKGYSLLWEKYNRLQGLSRRKKAGSVSGYDRELEEYDALYAHFHSRYKDFMNSEVNHTSRETLSGLKAELKREWKNALVMTEKINLLNDHRNDYTRKLVLFHTIQTHRPAGDAISRKITCPHCGFINEENIYLCRMCAGPLETMDITVNSRIRYLNEHIHLSGEVENSIRRVSGVIKRWTFFKEIWLRLGEGKKDYETIVIEQNQEEIFRRLGSLIAETGELSQREYILKNLEKIIQENFHFLFAYLPSR